MKLRMPWYENGTPGRIYIMPTRYGFIMGLGVLVASILAMAFGHNALFFVCFTLTAYLMIFLVQTNANFIGLKLEGIECNAVHAGGELKIKLRFFHRSRSVSMVRVTLYNDEGRVQSAGGLQLSKGEFSEHAIKVKAARRGKFRIRRILVSSKAPIGLFITWTVLPVNFQYYVYPRINKRQTLPASAAKQNRSYNPSTYFEFHGHQAHFAGSNPNHIDWKVFAKRDLLVLKNFDNEETEKNIIKLKDKGPFSEHEITLLASWVNACRLRNIPYSLAFDGKRSPYGQGSKHFAACMEALASYEKT